MRMLTRVHDVLRPRRSSSESTRDEAIEFLASDEAKDIMLHEFEERFGIEEIDYEAAILGYPGSKLYEPESKEEIARNRASTDAFLEER